MYYSIKARETKFNYTLPVYILPFVGRVLRAKLHVLHTYDSGRTQTLPFSPNVSSVEIFESYVQTHEDPTADVFGFRLKIKFFNES